MRYLYDNLSKMCSTSKSVSYAPPPSNKLELGLSRIYKLLIDPNSLGILTFEDWPWIFQIRLTDFPNV